MKKSYFIFIFLLANSIAFTQEASENISFDNAIETAYDNRSSLASKSYVLFAQKHIERQTWSGYLPQIHVGTRVSTTNEDFVSNHHTIINIQQLIFDPAGPIDNYRIAKKNSEIAWWQYLQERDDIRIQTELTFLDAWLALQEKDRFDALNLLANTTFAQEQEKRHIGLIDTSAWHDAVARYSEQRSTITGYTDDTAIAHALFYESIENFSSCSVSSENIDNVIARALFNAQAYDLCQYLDHAYNYRKELPQRRLEQRVEEITSSQLKRSYFPSSSLFAAITNGTVLNNDLDGSGSTSQTVWQVGIRFDWSFDGLANIYQAAFHSDVALERFFALQNEKNRIQQEVTTAYHEVQKIITDVSAAALRLEEADITFKKERIRYKAGLINKTAFDEAQLRYEESKFNLTKVQIETTKAYHTLLYKAGYPDEII